MAECNGGCAGCEHCGRAEADGYAPAQGDPIFSVSGAVSGYATTFPIAPSVGLVSSGCPVRDLGNAIRAIALTHATMPGQIDVAIRGALDIVRQIDGTHGCDVCRRFRATRSSVQVGGELDPGGVSDE